MAQKSSKHPKPIKQLVHHVKKWGKGIKVALSEKLVQKPKAKIDKIKKQKKIIKFIEKTDNTIFAGDRTIDKSKIDF